VAAEEKTMEQEDLSRRDWLKGVAGAVAAGTIGNRMDTAAARPDNGRRMIGIQVGEVSFVDEDPLPEVLGDAPG
jgi:hypothetical protein